MPSPSLPEIIAHRGNAAEFPENTLPALQSAVELGLRHVEFDVQLTADKVPVVFHDATLERVADRQGNLHELSWAELSGTPVGEIKRFGRRFAFTFPPSLAQAVEALAGWEGVNAFVEVKRSSLSHFGREAVLTRIAEVLQPVIGRCVLISFDLPSLKILRMMTGARIGWVLSDWSDAALAEATALAPDFLICNIERVPESAERLWPGQWQWAIYEVRDMATVQRCQSLGAAFVETMTVKSLLTAYRESRRQW